MNNSKFKIKGIALSDMDTISEFVAQDNKIAALKLLNNFYKTFTLLADNPNLGFKREDFTHQDVRFYVVKKHYLIVYHIIDDYIEIVRVLSAYQDICNKLL